MRIWWLSNRTHKYWRFSRTCVYAPNRQVFLWRLFCCLALIACLLALACPSIAAETLPTAPSLQAEAWVLMDYHSSEVLVEHRADEPLSPASLTKMMTAYVLFQQLLDGKIKLDDSVTVGADTKVTRIPGGRDGPGHLVSG